MVGPRGMKDEDNSSPRDLYEILKVTQKGSELVGCSCARVCFCNKELV